MVTEEEAWAGWREYLATGDVAGGRAFLAEVLDRDAPPSRHRALVLYADGLFAFRQGDMDGSRARNEAALAMARELGDDEAEAYALVGLSRVALRAGDYEDVVGLAERARALVRDDRDASVAPLHMQAAGTRLLGRYDEARALYEESLVLNRSRGDARMTAMELHNLMHVELHRGDVASAERRFEAWRSMVGASADPYDGAMWSLNNAAFAVVRGEPERATELLDEAEERLAAAGIVLDPDDASELHHLRGLTG